MVQPEPTGRAVVAATAFIVAVAVAGRSSLPEQPCDGEFQLPVVPDRQDRDAVSLLIVDPSWWTTFPHVLADIQFPFRLVTYFALLTVIGIAVLRASRAGRMKWRDRKWIKALPIISAIFVILIGISLCAGSVYITKN